MIWLSKTNTAFPSAEKTDENGILALGGDLSPERLIAAYRNGIFPWYNEGETDHLVLSKPEDGPVF